MFPRLISGRVEIETQSPSDARTSVCKYHVILRPLVDNAQFGSSVELAVKKKLYHNSKS